MLLTACVAPDPRTYVYPEYSGPVAAPQTVYRIDENRYFEVVPYENSACERATIYYNDKKQGIHSKVVAWDWGRMTESKFIIDAANTNYLVAPIKDSNADCGADTSASAACSARLPYSTDGGRTWKYGKPRWTNSGPIVLTSDQVFYAHSAAKIADLPQGFAAWKEIDYEFPQPRKAPLDTEFHCIRNGKE